MFSLKTTVSHFCLLSGEEDRRNFVGYSWLLLVVGLKYRTTTAVTKLIITGDGGGAVS